MWPKGKLQYSALSSVVSGALFVAGAAAWSWTQVFVRGLSDPKFGGPWDNFEMMVSLAVQAAVLLTAGVLLLTVGWTWRVGPPRLPAWLLGILTGLVELAMFKLGAFGVAYDFFSWALRALPKLPDPEVVTVLLPVFLLGCLAGVTVLSVVKDLERWREAT